MKLNICYKDKIINIVDDMCEYRGYKRINRLYATDKEGNRINLLKFESEIIKRMHEIYRIDKKGYIVGKRKKRNKLN